jgi:hypothetical protein
MRNLKANSRSGTGRNDFFLLRFRKEKIRGIPLTGEEEFISPVQAIFNEILESILISVDLT